MHLNRSCVKVYRKDQINICLFLILDKAGGLGIHHINIDFLILNGAESVNKELGIKADHNILSSLVDQKLRIHGAKAGI